MQPRAVAPDWETGLAALQRYVAVRGPRPVPPRLVAYGVEIGAWVAARREDYWTGRLPPDHVTALQDIDGWTWAGSSQRRWEKGLQALQRYVDRHGHLPPADASVGRFHVGSWVEAQRAAYADRTLPGMLARQLEAVPGWTWSGSEDRWTLGLDALRSYVAEHDSARDLSRELVHRGYPLGHWVQRCREDHRAGRLSAEQADVLDAVPGWSWGAAGDRWEQAMALLSAYVARHGHAAPPQTLEVEGFPLGMWVHQRRREHQRGQLTPPRTAALTALPGWSWTGSAAVRERHLTALLRYVDRFDRQPDVDAVFDGLRVGRWVARQRAARCRSEVDPGWTARLEQVPGWRW